MALVLHQLHLLPIQSLLLQGLALTVTLRALIFSIFKLSECFFQLSFQSLDDMVFLDDNLLQAVHVAFKVGECFHLHHCRVGDYLSTYGVVLC